jgi:hypothetical protein
VWTIKLNTIELNFKRNEALPMLAITLTKKHTILIVRKGIIGPLKEATSKNVKGKSIPCTNKEPIHQAKEYSL